MAKKSDKPAAQPSAIDRVKAHPVYFWIVAIGVVAAALAQTTGSLQSLWKALGFGPESHMPVASKTAEPCSMEGMVGKWTCRGECTKDHETGELSPGDAEHLQWVDGVKNHGLMFMDIPGRKFYLTWDDGKRTTGTIDKLCGVIRFPEYNNYAVRAGK